ncbi:hypothetical protein AB0K16_52245 [Nonomuraea jabiensis]|uniref:hypothetical protein n=1 Tax=Nonomuraea jabiensis TaxID=882448 RepID=UPI0034254E4A
MFDTPLMDFREAVSPVAKLLSGLRNPDRTRVVPYLPYLRLLFSAVARLPVRKEPLWRGVSLDLRAQYPLGRTVTWWGVSSCTST